MSYTNVRLILFSAIVLFGTLVGCDKTPSTPTTQLSSAKELTVLSVKDAKGTAIIFTVVAATGKLDITVPFGTNNKDIAIAYTIAAKAKISPDPATIKDYSSPQQFTVTAEDNSKQVYTVTVILAAGKSDNSILKFTFTVAGNNIDGAINEPAKTITVTLPSGTALTGLTPTITISEGATISPNTGTSVDFTSSVQYTVTAQNKDTRVYTVTVASATAKSGNSITQFAITADDNGTSKKFAGVIDETAKTITLYLPYGTAFTELIPTIEVSEGATTEPASGVKTDFSSTVKYTVTAENNAQNKYDVVVKWRLEKNDYAKYLQDYKVAIGAKTATGHLSDFIYSKLSKLSFPPADKTISESEYSKSTDFTNIFNTDGLSLPMVKSMLRVGFSSIDNFNFFVEKADGQPTDFLIFDNETIKSNVNYSLTFDIDVLSASINDNVSLFLKVKQLSGLDDVIAVGVASNIPGGKRFKFTVPSADISFDLKFQNFTFQNANDEVIIKNMVFK